MIRIPFGGGIGAVEHHSESPEAYFAHTAGLKVVACSNPVDAYWMIQQAVASDDPVIFFEPKRRYHEKAELDETSTPPPLHSRDGRPAGTDVTVLCYGPMVQDLPGRRGGGGGGGPGPGGDRPADAVPARHGDRDHLGTQDRAAWSRCTRRSINLGLGAELAARITEQCFYSLEAPVLRVGGFDIPYPPSRVEDEYLPDLDRVLDAVDRSLAY